MKEQALVFGCGGESLVGVLALPDAPSVRGVLIVVGGPQYRAGSHRQFTLLARELARSGVASLRFDYRGMGDSSGPARSFEAVDEDIGCALERLLGAVPELREVVIWGLCDAASAALFYAHRDARVSGVVLLNPWVRTEQGIAQAHLRHYYGRRLLDPSFWRKVFSGRLEVRAAFASLRKFVADAAAPRRTAATLPERMEDALRRFRGRVLLILSGKDLTADEFRGVVSRSRRWTRLLAEARIARRELAEANHTFSRREWRDQVARWTAEWVKDQ
ncbi:MAG TPA: hydrolase 1, exosortase A system-associated [Burkholderiales bacterium]|nr:hydrolase 1, exosortase A system-associated [Burkholderiales bacterium]